MADDSLIKQHKRIAKIGKLLAESKPLSGADSEFLGGALLTIGDGGDPAEALGINVKRGGTPLKKQRELYNRDQLALSWIAAAIASEEEGGLGLTLDDAIELLDKSNAVEVFGITADTIRKYWNNRPNQRNLVTSLDGKKGLK